MSLAAPRPSWYLTSFALVVVSVLIEMDHAGAGGMRLRDLVRVKGQEINTVQGLGLVVGLKGTGDGDAAPTSRALSRMMQLMGGPMSLNATGTLNLEDVADAKNVALVFVTGRLPEVGAQQGDILDVTVNAISAKSLEGGYLMNTPMLGPRSDNPTVYALASGPLSISPGSSTTSARVGGGMKMETTVRASYVADGQITLIIDRDFAEFDTAQRIEEEINSSPLLSNGISPPSRLTGNVVDTYANGDMARAIDQVHVVVRLPALYQSNPIKFIAPLLDTPVPLSSHSNRVVINEADGVVVIGEDVEIAPVLVTHNNLRIETGGQGGFVEVGETGPENAKLKSLADALGALDVPTEDLIAIIRTLKAKGDLYGEVIFR